MTVSLLSESICVRYACRLGAGFVLAVIMMMVVIGLVNPNAPPSDLPAKCARGLAWLKTQLDVHRDLVGEYPAGDNWWSQADIYNRYGGEDPATGRPIDPYGYPLGWSSDEARLWSIGVNGLDEYGLGDDIVAGQQVPSVYLAPLVSLPIAIGLQIATAFVIARFARRAGWRLVTFYLLISSAFWIANVQWRFWDLSSVRWEASLAVMVALYGLAFGVIGDLLAVRSLRLFPDVNRYDSSKCARCGYPWCSQMCPECGAALPCPDPD